MKLSDKWFTALSENDNGDLVAIYGRDELTEFDRVYAEWQVEGTSGDYLEIYTCRTRHAFGCRSRADGSRGSSFA